MVETADKSWSIMAKGASQQGQAMLAILAFVLVLAIALVYLFNSSQLLAERAQAKVLADHAAYNTATKQAQLLNANAYMNKAKIANQLAIAQAVSVASWAEYMDTLQQNSSAIRSIPVFGTTIHQAMQTSAMVAEGASLPMAYEIPANAVATRIISMHQNALNNEFYAGSVLKKEPSIIVRNSSIGAGFRADISHVSLTNSVGFTKRYAGSLQGRADDRIRMKQVLEQSRDAFTKSRRSRHQRTVLNLFVLRMRMEYRGGTELSEDMNQWKAVDTFSLHTERRRRLRGWRRTEAPLGYGSVVARKDSRDSDINRRYGYTDAPRRNPRATHLSKNARPSWDARNHRMPIGEYGVPEYWDLSKDKLGQADPMQEFSIFVTKQPANMDTTSGMSSFRVGETVDIKTNNKLTAISTAQVYFERPAQDRAGNSHYLNSGKHEKASLFNPYWQVRLVDNPAPVIAEVATR